MKENKNKGQRRTLKILDRIFVILCCLLIIVSLTYIGITYFDGLSGTEEINAAISDWESLPVVSEETANGEAEDTNPTDTSLETNDAIWGLLQIDSIQLIAPISQTKDWNLLEKYVVPFNEGDSPDVEGGNYALAAHWGHSWCSYCYFGKLDQISTGDKITVTSRSKIYTYEVTKEPWTIQKTDVDILQRITDQTTLTLVTCVTYGDDPRRTVVQAKLVSTTNR